MNRDAFVRGIVIGLRTQMNPKYPVDPSQLREIREQAETMADLVMEQLDDLGEQPGDELPRPRFPGRLQRGLRPALPPPGAHLWDYRDDKPRVSHGREP